MLKNPCFKCEAPKRHIGCHSKCEEYLSWKAEQDARKEAEAYKNMQRDLSCEVERNLAKKLRSRRKR